MKKMMVIMAVALAAGLSQAASVVWTSGAVKTVADASGTFGSNIGTTTGTYLATVYFYTDAGLTTPVLGVTGNTDDTSVTPTSTLNGTTSSSFSASTTYYAVLVITTESPYGTATLTSSAMTINVPGVGNPPTVNFLSSLPGQWTVVPEPTSMALLALGAATLGLRRRSRK
jgi:hypothetical protein